MPAVKVASSAREAISSARNFDDGGTLSFLDSKRLLYPVKVLEVVRCIDSLDLKRSHALFGQRSFHPVAVYYFNCTLLY